ncbi:N-acetylneuraminate synthase family protein [Candidatus Woesearchaeota archaeon]|nr:N-acetylneuraminate synthase family protein [Candidatus Woesearchaeota archaeon]
MLSSPSHVLSEALNIYENLALREKTVPPVQIGDKLVGHNNPVFVIAEIGINHNGSLDTAKKLIDMAVEVGCDAVKFQKRTVEDVYTKEELEKPRENPFGPTNGHLKRGLEFGEKEYKEIDAYCKKKGILWFASPWDLKSVDFLEKFDVPCYKIASATLTDKELLKKIKATGKPVILSTGMSTMQQIKAAVDLLGEQNLVLLHCTSTYPSQHHEQDLHMIRTHRKFFNCPIGFSGHEQGLEPTLAAIALGACVVERHITLDRSMWGSDQAASLEKDGISRICRFVRNFPIYLGSTRKRVHDSEVPIQQKLRKNDTILKK